MQNAFNEKFLPGFIGLIHREEGDTVVPRFTDNSIRENAEKELGLHLEPGETIQAVIPLHWIVALGAETAAAFRPRSQFELEDLKDALESNDMTDLIGLGNELRARLDSPEGALAPDTGPFELTGDLQDLGSDVRWHNDTVKDAEMIATLFENACRNKKIKAPTAGGQEIFLRVSIEKGFGEYLGHDSCLVRMYSPQWEYLATDAMPVEADFFARAIARANTERGEKLARELVLLALEYANTIYKNLGPYLTEEECEQAGIKATA